MTPPEADCSWPLSPPSPALEASFKVCFCAHTPRRPLRGFLHVYFILRLPLFISAKFLGSKAASEALLGHPLTDGDPGHSAGAPFTSWHTHHASPPPQPDPWSFFLRLMFGRAADWGVCPAQSSVSVSPPSFGCGRPSTPGLSSRCGSGKLTILHSYEFPKTFLSFFIFNHTTPLAATCWAQTQGMGVGPNSAPPCHEAGQIRPGSPPPSNEQLGPDEHEVSWLSYLRGRAGCTKSILQEKKLGLKSWNHRPEIPGIGWLKN